MKDKYQSGYCICIDIGIFWLAYWHFLRIWTWYHLGTCVDGIFLSRIGDSYDRSSPFFNNIYKLFLVGKYADKMVLVRFGIPGNSCILLLL